MISSVEDNFKIIYKIESFIIVFALSHLSLSLL